MSSMLKKTGGLAFKPKVAPRRAAPASSSKAADTTAAPDSAPQTPATEALTQARTPAPTVSSSVPPVKSPRPEAEETSKQPPKDAVQPVEAEKASVQDQHVPSTAQPPSRPVATSTTSYLDVAQPSQQPSSVPTPAPTQGATQATTAPNTDDLPQPAPSVSIPPPIERSRQPTPAPEVATLGTPPATNPDTSTAGNSSIPPAAVVSRPAVARSPLSPAPSAASVPAQPRLGPPTAPPSPSSVPDTIAVSAPVDEAPVTVPKKKRAYRKRASATTDDNNVTESPAPKKRRYRKKAAKEDNGAAPAEGEQEPHPGLKIRRRRRRSPTPEDAESQTVDHSTTKMADLTKDLGIGKRFKHADLIEERAREARDRFRQKRLEKQGRALGLVIEGVSESRAGTPAEDGSGRDSAIARARDLGASLDSGGQNTVGYEVIDGQIIVNQQSLIVDRHAAHRDVSNIETVEEDEFSRLTTSTSYRRESRRTGANHWTEEDTERFYVLLGQFGTDFETISHMFASKSRRAVKLKFNREELLNPKRIDATVMVRGEKKVSIDFEEYKAHQEEWQESDKILAEHAELVKEHNEDIRRLREERRAAGLLDDDNEEQASAGQEGESVGVDTSGGISEITGENNTTTNPEVAVSA
ncbi:hypothetical protein GGR54DRAFT_642237 [Hypoxylon sp. NC1633]|nr:hypothetical protein GGR54DRAFT_642237 [Hypoxylon sp. NC1633]